MPEWLIQGIAAIGGAVSVYAAIRADLARLHERATHAMESANQAHQRIDALQLNSQGRGRN